MDISKYINMKTEYRNYLYNIVYGFGYDLRLHALQTALTVLGYSNSKNVDKNALQYGYYDVNTENMILDYQEDKGFQKDGKISETLWNSIFDDLLIRKNCIIIKTGQEQITLYDINKLINNELDINNNSLDNNKSFLDILKDLKDNISDDVFIDLLNLIGERNSQKSLEFDKEYKTDSNGISLIDDKFYNDNDSGMSLDDSRFLLVNGGNNFDELYKEYLVSGGTSLPSSSSSYIVSGGESWNNDYLSYNVDGSANKDYDYIYNLLANTIFEGTLERDPNWKSKSSTKDIGVFNGGFEESSSKRPHFHPSNINELRKTNFDIQIVYGPDGARSKKILNVKPISVTQEINASGDPVYDVYEFIAKDVIENI